MLKNCLRVLLVIIALFHGVLTKGESKLPSGIEPQNLKNWKKAYDELSIFYFSRVRTVDSALAFPRLRELQAWAFDNENDYAKIICFMMTADKHARINRENVRAFDYYLKAIELADKSDEPLVKAMVRFKYGLFLYNANKLPVAIANMMQGVDITEKYNLLSEHPYYGEALYHLGRCFYDINELDRAEALLEKSANYPFKQNFYRMQAYNTLALLFVKKENYIKAYPLFNKAYKLADFQDNNFWRALINSNLGTLFYRQNKIDSSLNRLILGKKIIDLVVRDSDYYRLLLELNIKLLNYHPHQIKDYNLFFMEMDSISLKTGELASRSGTFEARAQYALKMKDFVGAALAFDSAFLIRKRLFEIERTKNAELEKLRIDTERELLLNEEKAKREYIEAEKNSLFISAALIFSVLGIGVLWQLYLSNRKSLKIKQQELEIDKEKTRNAELLAYQKEKELLEARALLEGYLQRIKELSEPIDTQSTPLDAEKTILLTSLRSATLLTNDDWDSFRDGFNKVYDDFLYNLKAQVPNLTQTDLRVISLFKLGLDNRQSAHALGVSTEAVKKAKQRLRAKLTGFDPGLSLDEIISRL